MSKQDKLQKLYAVRDPLFAKVTMMKGDMGPMGPQGPSGYIPIKGTDYYTEAEINFIIQHIQSKVKDGVEGKPGKDGKNGQTPIRGIDYWSSKDQEKILQSVLSKIPKPKDGISPNIEDIVRQIKEEINNNPPHLKDIKGTAELIEFLKRGGFRGGGSSAGGGGTPGGANTQVQFNNNGSFGGDSSFLYDSTTKTITLGDGTANGGTIQSPVGATSALTFQALAGQNPVLQLTSGQFTFSFGLSASTNTDGGGFGFTGNAGNGVGNGGGINFVGGPGGDTGDGGPIGFVGGNGGSSSGNGGSFFLTGGAAQGGNSNGGNILITPGVNSGMGTVGKVFLIDGNSGNSAIFNTSLILFNDKTFTFPNVSGTFLTTGNPPTSVSGNAGTATILQNARTIAGVSFDGSANISIASTNLSNTANIILDTNTITLTNKRITKRVVTVTQSATPTINTDNTDVAYITGLAQAVTSFTTNLSGTPVNGDILIIDITDNGSGRALTFGTSFEASTVALPTTTVASTKLTIGFRWNIVTSKWTCVAVA